MKSLPLSPMQQGLLFHYLRDGRSGVDVVQLVCALPERVEPGALRRAWEVVVARHEGLRAAIDPNGDPARATQRIEPSVSLDWTEEDWTGRSESDIEGFLREDRAAGFDLGRAPLWRLRLLRLGEADWRLVWTLHHIIADGRSCQLVLEEVFAAYEAALAGRDIELAPAVPSERFLNWLERRETAGGDERFWTAELAGVESPTRISDAGAGDGSGRGVAEERLSVEDSDQVRSAAERHGVTVNTLVQAAWALVLSRHAPSDDVIFGVIRAGRAPALRSDDRAVGVFINTVPMRVRIDAGASVAEYLRAVRAVHVHLRDHEHAPLARIQQWSPTPGTPLFDSILIYDHATLDEALRSLGGAWSHRSVQHLEDTGYPVTAYGYGEPALRLKVAWSRQHVADAIGRRLLEHFRTALLGLARVDGESSVQDVPVLTAAEHELLVRTWNETDVEDATIRCIHDAFDACATAMPDAPAVVCGSDTRSYAELRARSLELAACLRSAGIGRGDRIGICLDRTVDLPAALLAVLRTGAAYVPLDPTYPADRLSLMIEDARIRHVIASRATVAALPGYTGERTLVDEQIAAPATPAGARHEPEVRTDDVAYVIYTSGSTGRPKGVEVEHRNVANFFAAMDARIRREDRKVWLALTSLSFDISVLELLWTLTRGFEVVIHAEEAMPARTPGFSLFYFAAGGADDESAYRLLLEGARFADANGFEAVWTPERHFHEFGGLYPNPSVTGAAVAAVTSRVGIRAGSVVLPLHHPARVAEEWAVVDRLSGGRVGLSVASGWHPEDFVFAPDRYADRKRGVFEQLEAVRRLWRGESVSFEGPKGAAQVRTMPRPVQAELPVWVTTSGTRATFEQAGAIGANVLTHMLGQDLNDLAANIVAYRAARAAHGHDPAAGRVTLMVHTFVAEDDDTAREAVRAPMVAYLASAMDLVKNFAAAWTASSRRAPDAAATPDDILKQLSPEDREALLNFAFERYFETSGLMGSVDKCVRLAESIRDAGVDEIACLIDFGVDSERVLAHLELLRTVRERLAAQRTVVRGEGLARLIREHRVSHLQCTPSRARLLLADPETRTALSGIHELLVGGEALPGDLARALTACTGGRVLNMYGPTETTVWSSVHVVAEDAGDGIVPIGRPVANTRFYVTDAHGRVLPAGVPGELRIGGAGVARGYLGRPELTAERFVADRYRPGERVYRTGDIARQREDGVVEYLGREDQQVKVRGHRIEIGEIEAVAALHPGVREAAVIARADGAGGTRLVGYVVPANGANRVDRELRTWLAARLPEPMVPSSIVVLDAMPVTPNGKLNRRALPDAAPAGGTAAATPPRSGTEQVIAEIWKQVLGVSDVGASDNFFDIGGHSLLTVQVQLKLREQLGREVGITDLFRFPTIRSLAEHLDGGAAAAEGADAGARRAELRRAAARRRARAG